MNHSIVFALVASYARQCGLEDPLAAAQVLIEEHASEAINMTSMRWILNDVEMMSHV